MEVKMEYDIILNGQIIRWVEAKDIETVMKHIKVKPKKKLKKGVMRLGRPILLR